jgi:hypothetical protein
MGRTVRLAVVLSLATASLVATPWTAATATAAAARLAVSPAKPMKGESFTVSTTIPTPVARPVQLQRKGSRWKTIAKGATSAAGLATFTTATKKTVRLRIVAPATTVDGTRYQRLVTASAKVGLTSQSAKLATPARSTVGTSVTLTATVKPVRPGRQAVFQILRGKTWANVATASQDQSGRVTGTLPSQPAGRYSVRAIVPTWHGAAEARSTAQTVTFTPPATVPPAVTKLSPATGTTLGGTLVTLTGQGFTGATSVTFGGKAGAQLKVASSTSLTVATPAHAAGPVDVLVLTGHGTSAVNAAARFTFVVPKPALPAITAVSPATGGLAGGTVVTITGNNLASATSVAFGAVAATKVTAVSATQLRVTTPARNTTGAVDLVVTTSAGKATKASGFTFVALNGTLKAGQTLSKGTSLKSPSGTYELIMQSDGNLVVYKAGGTATWATGTSTGRRAIMQTDGNFVVYGDAGNAVWSSTTDGFPGADLMMQDDGNLVIYRSGLALWSKDGMLYDRLSSSQTLTANQSRLSPNHQYSLIMQGDGNLVLYRAGGVAVWASSTQGGGNWAVMQGDGNLVVYAADNRALWASGTAGRDGSYLRVQDDAKLVVYQGGTAVWDSSGPDAPFNAGIIASANGFVEGAYGGQCLVFVENRIRDAGGPSIAMGYDTTTYQNQWARWANEVRWAQVMPGDVVQFQVGSRVHTVIITSGNTPGSAQVIDSNWGLTEQVHRGSFQSRLNSWGEGTYKIWRVHR